MTIVIIPPLQTANTKSGLLHLCMLSLLVLEVLSFLFAYFTIALKHGVNEDTNIILFTLCLPQLTQRIKFCHCYLL